MDYPTVVIGAGLSGLHAAWRLQQAGQSVLLVDARDRAGGRILSLARDETGSHRVDLGPAWYWPDVNPLMAAWVKRLGLQSFPQHDAGGSLIETADGRVQRLGHTWGQQPVSMRLQRGMTSLVEGLLSQLTADVQWQLETRVSSLRVLPGGDVEVHLMQGGKHRVQVARRIVSTLPPRLLASLDVIPSWPAEDLLIWNGTPTWMAGQAKFVAAYAHPFWRDDGLSGTAMSQCGPMAEIHDACDRDGSKAALFGFIGVPPSSRQGMGEAVLYEQALGQLGRLFGSKALAPLWYAVQDWAQQPLTATARDQFPVRQHPVYRAPIVPGVWQGRLWLAGTEFSPRSGGYLEGALESAEWAVNAMLAADDRAEGAR